MIDVFSIGLAVVSIALSLYIYQRDRSNLQIEDFHVGLGGSRKSGEPWVFTVSSVSVSVRNQGNRPAYKAHGVVSFGMLDALPLYPTDEGNVIFQKTYDIAPNERRHLVAAWNYSGTGIDGMKSMPAGDFIERGPPVKVTIEYTEGTISKTYDKDFIESEIREHQERQYLQP